MTGKRRPSFDPNQGDFFNFEMPPMASAKTREGALEALERRMSSAVSRMIANTGRSRYDIAAGMSELLGQDISKTMLDAYASEAKGDHNISAARLFALVAETDGYQELNGLLRDIGAAILVGEEVWTAQLGHKRRQLRILSEEVAQLERSVPLITGSRK